ncbi:MAG: 30S ribosomal protein S20 [Candidatus Babeliales bacterium]
MANIKSAKKRAIQAVKRRHQNLARKTAIKTAIKKVQVAIEAEPEKALELLKDVQAQLGRAKSKDVMHANTAARKLSRLAKKVAAANR